MLGSFLPPVSAACGLSHRSSCPSAHLDPSSFSPTQLLPIDSSALPAATCSLHCQASGARPSNVPVVWFALVHDEEVALLQKPGKSFFPKSQERKFVIQCHVVDNLKQPLCHNPYYNYLVSDQNKSH